jgi:hypothetical protein
MLETETWARLIELTLAGGCRLNYDSAPKV